MCFNYFLAKDKCVHGTPGSKQCKAPAHQGTAAAFTVQTKKHKRSESRPLVRRYDTYAPVGHKAFGEKTCPDSIIVDDNAPGVCLWIGNDPNGEKGGWVNHRKNSNCGKQVWIQNKANTGLSVYAPVVASCPFDDVFDKPTEDQACFHIGLTTFTFNQLNPTDAERKAGKINRIGWDFNNIPSDTVPAGTKPQNGPV